MIKNKARKLLFLEAAIFLVIVYLLILGLNYTLDQSRINELDQQIKNYGLQHQSFLAINSFYETAGKQDCNFSNKYILKEYDEIKELAIDIASFKNRILKMNEELHDIKKREYLIAQAENLNKLQKHNQVCENKIFPIFYFVDGDIIGFNQQALMLQQFAMNYKDEIIIYTLDLNYEEEPLIKLLKENYNVTNHNTIIFGNLSNTEGAFLNINKLTQEYNELRGS